MITVGLSTVIAAPRRRVWRALDERSETLRWRPGLTAILDADAPYPVVGRTVRWRCRVRELPIEMRETPLEIVRGERYRTRLALGLFRFEETFTLTAVPGQAGRTRVGLQVHVANEMPVVGGTLDRFAVRRLATELSGQHLQALRDWCEAGQPRDLADGALAAAAH